MLASTPAGPQWTYHQWMCLLLARTAPPSLCRVSVLTQWVWHVLTCPFPSSTVPPPHVTVSANHTPPLYAGTGLTLTCTVSLNSSVDTDVSVSVTWTGPRTIPGERYSVMEASGSGGTYTGSLTVSPLAEGQDDGQYTCSVTVSGSSSMGAGSDSTTIDVNGNFLLHTNKPQHLYMPCLDNTHVQIHVYVYAFV